MISMMFRALVCLTLVIPGSIAFSQDAPINAAMETTASIAKGPLVYEVGPGKEYETIEAALAAATNPDVDKFIKLAAHTFEYPLDRDTRLQLRVPRTHLQGEGPDKTRIIASNRKVLNSTAVIEVRASTCTVEGLWVENRWKEGDPHNKQTAMAVGTGEDPKVEPDSATWISDIKITNCKMTATTRDRLSRHLAWDVVTVGANVTNAVFEKCEMRGFADVFSSWGQRVDVNDCIIDAVGWNALWVTIGRPEYGFPQESLTVFRNCQLGSSHYYLAGGMSPGTSGVPVVYLKNCRPYPANAEPVELARMQLLSNALTIVVGNTAFLPYGTMKGVPEPGNPPTTILPDTLLRKDVLKVFE